MTTCAASLRKTAKQRGEGFRKHRPIAIVGVVTILIGLILMPFSKISEPDKVSSSQTQTASQSLCPPPITTSLESGNCHITIIEHLPNLTTNARIAVYDQNNSVLYQSSVFEEVPYLVKRDYNFTVIKSGIYNITLENAGVFFVKVETTTMIWTNITTYPFEPFFYSGLVVAFAGWCLVCLSLVIEKMTRDKVSEV